MSNAVSLIHVQAGIESAWGTEAAATARLMGIDPAQVKWTPQNIWTPRRYARADYAPIHKVLNTSKGGMLSLAGDLNLEDVVSIFNSSIHGGVTGAGAGSDKTWSWAAPMAAAPTAVHSRTMEITDGGDPFTIEGCTCKSWEISGGSGEDSLIQIKSEWQAQDYTTTAITAALADRTVNYLAGQKADIYIEAFNGTVGSTAKTGCLIDWSVSYSGIEHRRRAAAALTPYSVRYKVPEIVMNLTLENNTAGKAEKDAAIAGTGRLIEIRGVGAAIDAAFHTLKLQAAGYYDVPTHWDSDENDTTISLSLRVAEDPGTFANYFKAIVINTIAAEVW